MIFPGGNGTVNINGGMSGVPTTVVVGNGGTAGTLNISNGGRSSDKRHPQASAAGNGHGRQHRIWSWHEDLMREAMHSAGNALRRIKNGATVILTAFDILLMLADRDDIGVRNDEHPGPTATPHRRPPTRSASRGDVQRYRRA